VTFTPRKGAAVLVSAAAAYLVAVVATGRSARAEVPPDVMPRAADAALDVWKAAAGLVEADGRAVVLDVRPADAFARYHLPGAVSVPGASASDVASRAAAAAFVLVYAGKDEIAQKLVADARRAAPGARVHYLVDGARAWYLALALPVPLFADAAPPDGYADALARLSGWLARTDPAAREATLEAIQALAKASYQPSLLKAGGAPKAGGGSKKKISGGCG
jgi:rhodanese-related sulfurtransferase